MIFVLFKKITSLKTTHQYNQEIIKMKKSSLFLIFTLIFSLSLSISLPIGQKSLISLESTHIEDQNDLITPLFNENVRNNVDDPNSWSLMFKKVDLDNNGMSDYIEERIEKSKQIENSKQTYNGRKILTKEDILNEILKETIVDDDELSLDNIPIIVQFPDNNFDSVIESFQTLGGSVKSIYDTAIFGFAGSIDYDGLMTFNSILNEKNIRHFIEEDTEIQAQVYFNSRNMNLRPYVWNTLGYTGDPWSSIAIVDTGIDDSHNLVSPGYSSGDFDYKIVGWRDEVGFLSSPYDDNAHGSHCAGIAAGNGITSLDVNGSTIATWGIGMDLRGYTIPEQTITVTCASFNVTKPGWVEVECEFVDSTPEYDDVDVNAYLYNSSSIVDSYNSGGLISWTHNLSYNATDSELGEYSFVITIAFDDHTGDNYCDEPWFKFRGVIVWPFDPPLYDSGDPMKGVAPDTHLVGVKVMDAEGGGYTSDIIDGIDWVITNRYTFNITVMSLSLGGSSGQVSLINAVNNAVDNGIVTVVSAGNEGAPGNNVGSPGDADNVISVAATSWLDKIAEYSSSGGASYTGYTIKPDIAAPGGSDYNFSVFSIDTGDSDSDNQYTTDAYPNDLTSMKGTSMSAPAVAGAANLLIQAMGGRAHWGYTATEAKTVKSILLMTATETYPLLREADTSYSPTLDRGGKDIHEGYGRINIDAAIEVSTYELTYGGFRNHVLESSLINPFGKHALGCYVNLNGGEIYGFNLDVPGGADFDLHLYSSSPNSYGDPIMVASSTSATIGQDEKIMFNPSTSGKYYLVAKAISGSGLANLSFVINDYQPSLTGEMVSPTSGNQSTPLTFNVTYSDQDNNEPLYVNVSINGTHYPMSKKDPLDINYIDGCVFDTILYLQEGNYYYTIECADFKYTKSTSTHSGISIIKTNFFSPTLANEELNTAEGNVGETMFTFRVNYSDPDNNKPDYMNLTINSTSYIMNQENPYETNYMDGCWYYYSTKIYEPGNYTYYFNCSDGSGDVSSGPFIGPNVTINYLRNYSMIVNYAYNWEDATTGTRCNMAYDDDEAEQFYLPFTFYFYDIPFNNFWVCTNGFLSFIKETEYYNYPFPTPYYDYMIAPYWDDLEASYPCNIYVKNLTSPNRVVIEWQNIKTSSFWGYSYLVGTFEVVLYETGEIIFNYDYLDRATEYTCGLNLGTNISYFTVYEELNTSMDDFSIKFVRNLLPALLSGESLTPKSGYQNTLFNFSANYRDPEDIAPTFINITHNTLSYPLTKKNSLDTDYSDGTDYQALIYLQPGTYWYKFECGDGGFVTTTPVYTGLVVGYTNFYTPYLLNSMVNSTWGTNESIFNFSVLYYDDDNNFPSYIYITINNYSCNWTYPLQAVYSLDTNAMDGKGYCYTTLLDWGSYRFLINYSDGVDSHVSSWFMGPSVSPYTPPPGPSILDYWYLFVILGVVIGAVIPTVIYVKKKRGDYSYKYKPTPSQSPESRSTGATSGVVSFEEFVQGQKERKYGTTQSSSNIEQSEIAAREKQAMTSKIPEEPKFKSDIFDQKSTTEQKSMELPKITEEPKTSLSFKDFQTPSLFDELGLSESKKPIHEESDQLKIREEQKLPETDQEKPMSLFDDLDLKKEEQELKDILAPSISDDLNIPEPEKLKQDLVEEQSFTPQEELHIDETKEISHRHFDFKVDEPNFICNKCQQKYVINNSEISQQYICPDCGDALNRLVKCPHCSQLLSLDQSDFASVVGKVISCPICQSTLEVKL
ncbi:MAG: hypothetical protein EAX96_03580 [Candidatus Lokiarchaeota archaeon]|nr:hypothetical protein [Candidatus Lokiarchaeota archaeon]